MGYYLQAIVSTQSVLEKHIFDYAGANVVPINQGHALIPVTDDLLDEIGADGASGKFEKYTPALADWLNRISISGKVAYIEAEYFGGVGEQSSVVWNAGHQVLGPEHGASAINAALRCLEVRSEASDEFDAIGLGRHRHVEDWLEEALPKTQHG